MKKWMIFCITLICTLSIPITCMAKTSTSPIETISPVSTDGLTLLGSGYTEDGVYYEVYGEEVTTNPSARVAIEVERTVVYDGKIFPPQTISWVEEIGVLECSGTLTLSSFYYNATTNKTTAIYVGTLIG